MQIAILFYYLHFMEYRYIIQHGW